MSRVSGARYFGAVKKGSCRVDGSRRGSIIGSGQGRRDGGAVLGDAGRVFSSELDGSDNGRGGVEVRALCDEGGKNDSAAS